MKDNGWGEYLTAWDEVISAIGKVSRSFRKFHTILEEEFSLFDFINPRKQVAGISDAAFEAVKKKLDEAVSELEGNLTHARRVFSVHKVYLESNKKVTRYDERVANRMFTMLVNNLSVVNPYIDDIEDNFSKLSGWKAFESEVSQVMGGYRMLLVLIREIYLVIPDRFQGLFDALVDYKGDVVITKE